MPVLTTSALLPSRSVARGPYGAAVSLALAAEHVPNIFLNKCCG